MAMIQTFPTASGSGSGHTILDTSGTAAAQEKNLQFKGLAVTDDSTNEITEVAGEGLNSDSIDDIAGANTINPAVIIGDSNNYSTTEKIIGKWINGKPLYQKTFTFTNITINSSNQTNIGNISDLNIDVGWVSQLMAVESGKEYCEGLGYVAAWIRNANNNIGVRLTIDGISTTFPNVYVTLQYTKTTD